MNSIDKKLKKALQSSVKKAFDIELNIEDIVIEIPKDKSHGDYSSSIAMRLAKQVGNNPRAIAEEIMCQIDRENIKAMQIAGPGFINFTLKTDSLTTIIAEVLEKKETYGTSNTGEGQKVNCEYVSANPTGDLHLGHARGAAWGDSVTRLMKASGYDVTREFYVNDAGKQVDNLAQSLYSRYCELYDIKKTIPEDGYFGDDIKGIANKIFQEYGDIYLEESKENLEIFKQFGIKYELNKLKTDLNNFRVEFDVFSSEQEIRDAGKVEAAVEILNKLGMTYEKDGALWFETTKFGDDKDRVLQKTDGSYTYLVPDIAYHINKLDRGFDKLVDFLGADHHGYVPRLKASIEALGRDSNTLEVDIIQMVRLVEDGKEIKMSKRLGNAITLRELCEEVGVDAARYFFVQRALDTHFDFDMTLAKKKSNENPVFYAQYAYARICSILKASEIDVKVKSYDLLLHEKEVQLLKYMNEFANVISDSAKNRAPNKVCNYIQKLASLFHSFYGACKVNDPENKELSAQRLDLLKACKIILQNALYYIGVEAIEVM